VKRYSSSLLLAVALMALVTLSCSVSTCTDIIPTTEEPPPPPTEASPPTEQPPPPPAALLQDDFSDPNSGWTERDAEDGSVAGYGNGYYRVFAIGEGWMWGEANQNLADVVVDVDATQVSAPPNNNNGYGMMCRYNGDADAYLFAISGDGLYSIHIIVDGEFEQLVGWTASDAINQGNATNHIRVICDGTHLALIVNGVPLADVEDDTYSEGDISLTANSYEDEPTEIHFDNVVVTEPRRP